MKARIKTQSVARIWIAALAAFSTACGGSRTVTVAPPTTSTATFTPVPTATPTLTPTQTDTPTVTSAPTDIPTSTPTPTITDTPLRGSGYSLPAEEASIVDEIAKNNNLTIAPGDILLANANVYPGPSLVLAPVQQPARLDGVNDASLADVAGLLKNVGLGVLAVGNTDNSIGLKPDTYVLTLQEGGKSLLLIGKESKIAFPAVVRRLNAPLPDKTSLSYIGSEQLCVGWQRFQVCGLVKNRLTQEQSRDLAEAAKVVGGSSDVFALDRAIADVEGLDGINACASVLQRRDYAACQPNVLVAPIEGLPKIANQVQIEATTTMSVVGLIKVYGDIKGEVHRDVALKERVDALPKGQYVLYATVSEGELITRVGFASKLGATSEFFVAATTGDLLQGTPLGNVDGLPDARNQVFIGNYCLLILGTPLFCTSKGKK